MITSQESVSMALFCDFENVALGVRDAQYERFDIKLVLERLLLKGSIVVKKAYCDWERYKGFKAAMHEANFELIDIPHVRQSGKNSADIRLVVDALDLCYTKSHVDTFVIISGDSDFSPLVSKLRENAKHVIGVGVKQSTSDLLIANCDEFIFYDDLVREVHQAARRDARTGQPATTSRRQQDEDKQGKDGLEARRSKGIALAVETFDALMGERGDGGKIWASVLKEAIKRRRPDFNESYYGFRAFGNLLEAAQERGLLEFGRDEKSGAYVSRTHHEQLPTAAEAEPAPVRDVRDVREEARQPARQKNRRNDPRQRRNGGAADTPAGTHAPETDRPADEGAIHAPAFVPAVLAEESPPAAQSGYSRRRAARQPKATETPEPGPSATAAPAKKARKSAAKKAAAPSTGTEPPKPARKTSTRRQPEPRLPE